MILSQTSNRVMEYQFFLGIDAVSATEGEGVDVALTLVEKEEAADNDDAPTYRLHRLEEGTAMEDAGDVADHVQSLLTQQPFVARTVLTVNRTEAAGQAVFRALADRGLAAIGAELTAGTSAVSGSTDEMNAAVSAFSAVDTLTNLYRGGHLDLAPLQEKKITSHLVHSLQQVGSNDAADDETASVRHELPTTPSDAGYDPLLMSAALACWMGEEQSFDPLQHLKTQPDGVGHDKRGAV